MSRFQQCFPEIARIAVLSALLLAVALLLGVPA